MSAGIILTGSGIQAYRYLATFRGLEMEINMRERFDVPPSACPTRGMAFRSARRILEENGVKCGRTRKRARDQMEALCRELNLIS